MSIYFELLRGLEGIRTPNRCIRSTVLYPVELQVHLSGCYANLINKNLFQSNVLTYLKKKVPLLGNIYTL